MSLHRSELLGLRCLVAAGLAWVGAPAWAHTAASSAGGLLAGLLHPVQGVDHLLAMVAVGLWGAFLGPTLRWSLPVVFPLLMVVGAMLGMAGIAFGFVEAGIAASVVVLGAAIAAGWRAPAAAALVIVAGFGLLHGHAHGTELPEAAAPVAYAAGFVVATGALHLAGIALGEAGRSARGRMLLRGLGAAMAAAGAWMLVRAAA